LLSPPEDGVSLFVCSRSVLLARNRIVATIIIDCGFGRTCDQRKKTALLEIYRQTEWYVRPKRTWSYGMECRSTPSNLPRRYQSTQTSLRKHAQGELLASATEPEPATLKPFFLTSLIANQNRIRRNRNPPSQTFPDSGDPRRVAPRASTHPRPSDPKARHATTHQPLYRARAGSIQGARE
jgi:hypothetical protein